MLLGIVILGNIAFAESKGCLDSTVPEDVEYSEGWLLEWDTENSATEFPVGVSSVSVAVKGGESPYSWEVSPGFSLACGENCGTSNTLGSSGTECIATITITDDAGRKTSGKVRRPGSWGGPPCYYDKMITCNSHCGWEKVILDFGDHLVEYVCCDNPNAPPYMTGTCDGGFQYTAYPVGCPCDFGIFSLKITKWTCD